MRERGRFTLGTLACYSHSVIAMQSTYKRTYLFIKTIVQIDAYPHHLTINTLLALDTIAISFYDFIIGPTYLLLPWKVPHTRDVKANVIKYFEAFKDTMMVFIAIVSNNIIGLLCSTLNSSILSCEQTRVTATGTSMHQFNSK